MDSNTGWSMTGPAHYKEAERLIGSVQWMSEPDAIPMLQPGEYDDDGGSDPRDVLALAQVHATLALAAEIALPWSTDGPAA